MTTSTRAERNETRQTLLSRAKVVKNDEFYTCYEDIEKEVSMYDKCIWKDKVIFCNCNDAMDGDNDTTASFTKFFMNNFTKLGLKKLICLHYAGEITILNTAPKGFITYYDGVTLQKVEPNNYTGSFDDPLSIKILNEEADIVVTNPPFSKARQYWKLVVDSGKKFLIVSNLNNIITSAYIPYFQNNKVRCGCKDVHSYENTKGQLVRAAGCWYTNLPVADRPMYRCLKIIPLKDIPEKYKVMDDNNVLLVDHCYIPSDYDKPFAVSCTPVLSGVLEKGYKIAHSRQYYPRINGRSKYTRILIQKSK